MLFQTEYEFTLPKGYVDEEGNIHRRGSMRLATALDELEAMKDYRVKSNPDYLAVMLLSRVVEHIGDIDAITPEIIEKMFTADFQFLQNMYETINHAEEPVIQVQCPHCGKNFTDTLNFVMGE